MVGTSNQSDPGMAIDWSLQDRKKQGSNEHRKNHHVSRQASPFRNTKVLMFAQKQTYWDGI